MTDIKRYKVSYSAEALDDLMNIYSYISFALKAKKTASEQVNRIRNAIRELDTFPGRYKSVDWEPWASKGVHQFSINNYVIFYSYDDNKALVYILRIFFGKRDIENIIQNEDTE